MRTPDLPGYLVGWRYWRLSPDGAPPTGAGGLPAIASPMSPDDWWPHRAPFRALCRRPHQEMATRLACALGMQFQHVEHEAPGSNCTCGIYALKMRARLLADLVWCHDDIVYGTVALWGWYIEHEYGWRAQYAYPLELWMVSGLAKAAGRLIEAYGIPVHHPAERIEPLPAWSL